LRQPSTVLDRVVLPDGRELVLSRRGDRYSIRIGGADLMLSHAPGSERALARLALEALGARPAPRILVGGLGMGYTLRAVLDRLGERARATVIVAEAFPAVVAWGRGVLAPLAGDPLDDRRVRVEVDDVVEVVARAREPFDAILLDVDNGPEALTLDGNRRLYTARGLARLHAALAPGGVLAVWSAGDDPRFVKRLAQAGFEAGRHRAYARPGGRGGRHTVFLGRRP
jgi:spermidine synthase